MNKEEYVLMINHEHWANGIIIEQLVALDSIPDKTQQLMNHILGAQSIWISRINGTKSELAVWPNIHCTKWDAHSDRHQTELLHIVKNEELLHSEVHYKNTAGVAYSNKVNELILHLCLHSQYHRGQIVTHTRDLIAEPASTDMISFLRF
jgi:uncharacterized damage-inducible protein DinB